MKKISLFVFSICFFFAHVAFSAIVSLQSPNESQFFCKTRFKSTLSFAQCLEILSHKHIEIEALKIVDQAYGDHFLSDSSKIQILDSLSLTKKEKRPSAYYDLLNSFTNESQIVEAAKKVSKLPILTEKVAQDLVKSIVLNSQSPEDRIKKINQYLKQKHLRL